MEPTIQVLTFWFATSLCMNAGLFNKHLFKTLLSRDSENRTHIGGDVYLGAGLRVLAAIFLYLLVGDSHETPVLLYGGWGMSRIPLLIYVEDEHVLVGHAGIASWHLIGAALAAYILFFHLIPVHT